MIKGTLPYELLSLPAYWWTVWSIDTSELRYTKVLFGTQRQQYFLKVVGPQSVENKVVVYYHGGGWIFGSPEQFVQNALIYTRKGYTVYMPSYRRLPYYGFDTIEKDLKAALAKIAENITQPITKLILSGMSAGAHLTGWLSVHHSISWKKLFHRDGVDAYIGVGAPLDLAGMWQSPVLHKLAGKKKSERFNRCNPINHLRENHRFKIMSISGGKDGIVPYSAQQSFEQKAQELNLDLTILHQSGSTHMNISRWSIPGTSVNLAVNEFLDKVEKCIN